MSRKLFNCVIGNPPYQAPQIKKGEKRGGGTTLWNKFVEKSFKICKEDGFIALIHPAAWRNVEGRFNNIANIIRSKQIKYLEIHNIEDGMKTFSAATRYDWYVVKNSSSKESTIVIGEDKQEYRMDLSINSFIPNGRIEEITNLFARKDEEKCNIIFSYSDYETRQIWMSNTQIDEFIYPCVQHVSIKNNLPSCLWYSNTNNKGYFNIPKVIFSRQCCGVMVDKNGEYGMCQHATAIIDKSENLENIQKAMLSEKFIELMKMCDIGGNGDRYNRAVIALFRKNFWKEFIED